jgi:O-antigen/teichoic acid export membrane protein
LPRETLWKRVVPFAGWILLGSLLTNLFGMLDRYMILHFSEGTPQHALDTVGNYHSSRVIPLLLVSIATMLGSMIIPHLAHDWECGHHEKVADRLRLHTKLISFTLFVGATAVLILAPILFGVAFRGKFPEGELVLPWTLAYCTWFGTTLIVQNYLICAERAWLISVAMASGLLVNIVLNVLLLPSLGLRGAVLAAAVANALSLGLICLFNRRLGFRLDNAGRLVLLLPLLLLLGPWISLLAIAWISADAIWANRLLSPQEKQKIADHLWQYRERLSLRWKP